TRSGPWCGCTAGKKSCCARCRRPGATCRTRRGRCTSAWGTARGWTTPRSSGPAGASSASTTPPSTRSTTAPSPRSTGVSPVLLLANPVQDPAGEVGAAGRGLLPRAHAVAAVGVAALRDEAAQLGGVRPVAEHVEGPQDAVGRLQVGPLHPRLAVAAVVA